MFSLIITIISIALVAALALATIYYGGSAFTQGGDAAKASQLINEGQQLQGARTLRKVQEPTLAEITAPADLTTTYLAQAPAGWAVAGSAFESAVVSPAVCAEVNKKAGITASPVVAADLVGKVYGCITADNKVTYKF